jgi:predicted ATPase/DNA-binding SARP family transcriptional activator
VRIDMLGPFEVRGADGGPAEVPGARLRALLTALALEPGRLVGKGTLIDWIWGAQPPADASNALQRLVSRLRKVLPAGVVEGHTDGYRLAVDPDAVDAVRFERLVAQGRLPEALGLWRGAAMQDVGLTGSAAFDAAVTRLESLRLSALEDRFESEIGLGHGAGLVAGLTALAAAHPLRESLVGLLMRALAAAGRENEALQLFQRTREALAEALGADPSPELSALHVSLLRGETGRRQSNLRAELTSYVGKDAEVAAVKELVGGHRLTTLTGPGGTGKTRMATETGRALLDTVPDGVWLVELAAIGADGDVARAALAALGRRDALLGDAPNAEPIDRVVAALRDREALLILDNCEHVIEQAAAFAYRVLGECRRLRILATSREPLGITGEALWQVEPLDVRTDAVRLLRDRAGAVRKDLGSAATLERVCRALDGMPLAIELAAARLRSMSLEQLADRLDDRFRLLTGGSRTALPRHRTLRAVVDWSWELLSDAERAVLRRLSVFSGGATLEAAEKVCAVGDGDMLELLTALTEKSLLVGDGGRAPRYRMLGTIKEYADRRLAEAWESDVTRRAHLAYFTGLAERADPHLRRAEQLEWLARLEAEHDNIAAAMRGALAAGETRGAVRLAASAGWYWWLGGHKAEGHEMIMAAARLPGDADDGARAVVLALATMFMSDGMADQYSAEEWIRRAGEVTRRVRGGHPALRLVSAMERLLLGPDAVPTAFEPLLTDDDPWVRALARLQTGKMRVMLGDGSERADADLAQALAEFRALGERWGISFALTELADRLTTRGELARARDLYEEAIGVVAEVGVVEDVVSLRSRVARLYWLMGEKEASASAMAEAQRYAERVAWPTTLAELALARVELARWNGDDAEARRQLAVATALLGDDAGRGNVAAVVQSLLGYLAASPEEAGRHRRAALRAASEAGAAPLIASVLVGIADQALRAGEFEQAARLLAASDAVRGLPDRGHPDAARISEAVRRHLGEAAPAEAAVAGWRELAEITLAS